MATDTERALAFVARRQGKGTLPAGLWAHILSLELGWMGPAQARSFVEQAKHAGCLEPAEGDLRATFSWREVEVPRGFRPEVPPAAPVATEPTSAPSGPSGPTPDEAADPFLRLVDDVAEASGTDRNGVLSAVAAKQESFGGTLEAEAAAMLLAAEAGLDVAQRAQDALDRLRRTQGT